MPSNRIPRVPRPIRRRRAPASTLGAVLVPACLLASALPAQAEGCRLALVLALDVSGSVSASEDRLQREGLAAALLAPEVARAVLSGEPVALYAFEWAGSRSQVALLPGWQTIASERDLAGVAERIRSSRRGGAQAPEPVGDGTAVGSALVHAAAALAAGPDCSERTVDVSGDGVSTQGIDPEVALDSLFDGITVNALVIQEPYGDPMMEWRHGGDIALATWFERSVVHGPGAFYVLADGYDDYERAMRAKLRRETDLPLLSQAVPGDRGAIQGG